MNVMPGQFTKAELARFLGIARSTLYYVPRQSQKDWDLKIQVENVLHEHPSYGHKRIALHLALNKKRILRVMHLFGIKPYRRRRLKPRKKKDEGAKPAPYENLLLRIPFPHAPYIIWVSDFTHIRWKNRWIYLATIMDLYTRIIVGWHVLLAHHGELVSGAFVHATCRHPVPKVLHSDQGSEYRAKQYTESVEKVSVQISMSRKGCPWENGYQESFYAQFKVDLGDSNRFKHLGELIYAIHQTMNQYNNARIHTSLKMPPMKFFEQYQQQRSKPIVPAVTNVSEEMGT